MPDAELIQTNIPNPVEVHQDHLGQPKLFIDYNNQFKLAKSIENGREAIFNGLKDIAKECLSNDGRLGLIIVFGAFDNHRGKVFNVAQMGANPVTSYKTIYDDDFKSYLYELSKFDGALIINRTGQILGARTYLVIDNPDSIQDEDCGTRHRAAASFSRRDDVSYVFTLSEETLKVRQWSKGEVEEIFEPKIKKDPDPSNGDVLPKKSRKSNKKIENIEPVST
jgi:DNA integrity scanning protein DisA with diadenylate cyclase activity